MANISKFSHGFETLCFAIIEEMSLVLRVASFHHDNDHLWNVVCVASTSIGG